jgi:hypothetical protein
MKIQHPPLLFAILIAMLPAAALRVEAADSTDQFPRFQFNPLDAFKGDMKYSFSTLKSGAYASICSGFWRSPNAQQSSSKAKQTWSITVSKRDDPKIADAYNAKDAFAVDLARADSGSATPYLYARFQKFSFPWGNAVGYFVQTTKDTTWPEPNNAQLVYEIRGVTSDRQDTIVGRFVVRNPQLPDGSSLQDAHGDIRTLTSFPTYKLLVKSSADSFAPSLNEIQDLVSSIVILVPKKSQTTEKKPEKPQ